MQLTFEKINELTDLNTKIQARQKEIDLINNMMGQLTADDCEVTVLFRVHNKTVHALNEAAAQASMSKHGNCLSTYQLSTHESPGLRILHAIRQERQMIIDELQKQLHDCASHISSPQNNSDEHL